MNPASQAAGGGEPRPDYKRRDTSASSSTALQEPSQVLSPSFVLLLNNRFVSFHHLKDATEATLLPFLCILACAVQVQSGFNRC